MFSRGRTIKAYLREKAKYGYGVELPIFVALMAMLLFLFVIFGQETCVAGPLAYSIAQPTTHL